MVPLFCYDTLISFCVNLKPIIFLMSKSIMTKQYILFNIPTLTWAFSLGLLSPNMAAWRQSTWARMRSAATANECVRCLSVCLIDTTHIQCSWFWYPIDVSVWMQCKREFFFWRNKKLATLDLFLTDFQKGVSSLCESFISFILSFDHGDLTTNTFKLRRSFFYAFLCIVKYLTMIFPPKFESIWNKT